MLTRSTFGRAVGGAVLLVLTGCSDQPTVIAGATQRGAPVVRVTLDGRASGAEQVAHLDDAAVTRVAVERRGATLTEIAVESSVPAPDDPGGGGDRFLALVDGVPVKAAQLDALSLDDIARIELLRGRRARALGADEVIRISRRAVR